MLRFIAGVTIGLVCTVVGALVIVPSPRTSDSVYGQFVGQVRATFLEDGRHMQLVEDFAYIDPYNKRWVAPAGSVIDGASIPQVFWSFLGGPFEGQFRNASVIHDVSCQQMIEPSDEVHRAFYFACRCGGVSEAKAKALYYAVSQFGPRWDASADTQAAEPASPQAAEPAGPAAIRPDAALESADGRVAAPRSFSPAASAAAPRDAADRSVQRARSRSMKKRPCAHATREQAEAVLRYFEKNNPTLDEIQRLELELPSQ